jgi:ABC-type nitrate/sulfonate/bicarbonate transport system substrate-binding protein
MKFKNVRKYVTLLACAIAIPFGASAEPIKIVLGDTAQAINAVAINAMIEQKIDQKHGISVEYKLYPTIDGLFTAIRGGDVNVGFGGWTAFAQFRQKGAPITMIFPVGRGSTLDVLVPADSSIKTFADLKSKRIGSYAGPAGTATVLLRVLAKTKGFDPAEASLLQFGNGSLLMTLVERNDIDAALVFDPIATKAIASGKFRSVGGLANLYKDEFKEDFLWIGLAMHDSFAAKHPDAGAKFVKAWLEAIDYVKKNPTAFASFAKQFGLDDAGTKLLAERVLSDFVTTWNEKYIKDLNNFAKVAREVVGPGFLEEVPASTFTTKYAPN